MTSVYRPVSLKVFGDGWYCNVLRPISGVVPCKLFLYTMSKKFGVLITSVISCHFTAPWSQILLWELIVSGLVKRLTFYGTRCFSLRKHKVIIYKTLIKPVSIYGVETRVLSKADELRLGVSERKILRRIYGPICEEATWKSRYNEELYRLYDETDLVTTIKITRLRWAGHVVRMQDNLPCKKITLDKPEGRRRAGRPDLGWMDGWMDGVMRDAERLGDRWMDGVMRDAERLGVRNWRIKARDKDGWRRLLESAKTLHGL
jgi:hypothetical protein